MTEKIQIEKFNNVYIRIICPSYIGQELNDYFSFRMPGYQFTPAYKFKKWDGYIKLYNMFTGLIYAGLRQKVELFAKERNYEIEYLSDFSNLEFSVVEAVEFIKSLKLPEEFKIRDYQAKTIISSIRNRRVVNVSAVNSGKSLIIYVLVRFFDVKTLILVPKISLVEQMFSDFEDYGFDSNRFVHKIYSGEEKDSEKHIYISTWQSLYKLRKDYFNQFKLVICDEVHRADSKSITSIMEKCENAEFRFGFTGTLKSENVHKLVLEGLFGVIKNVVTSDELIKKGVSSPIKIKAIVLQYPEKIRNQVNKRKKIIDGKSKIVPYSYQEEIDFLINYNPRTNFIKNLALSLKGNTFLAFRRIEEQGKTLYELIKKDSKGNVYYIDGQTKIEERERIRKIIDEEIDSVLCASLGVFQEGTNIKKIHNMIFTYPSKSTIVVLQTIGRGLRKSKDKIQLTLFDIADDLSWKKRKNYTLEHFAERIKIYNEQNFNYKIYNVSLKSNV